jgi:uncharacterized protein YeaO (DUF488 family)
MSMINKIRPDHIKLKRAYEPPAPDDGTRILIDRLWPRGVKKADAAIDEWMKEIAPSTGLRLHVETVLRRARWRRECAGAGEAVRRRLEGLARYDGGTCTSL